MSPTYLLDTNVVSALYRSAPGDPLHARISDMEGALCVAAPVWHELRLGAQLLPVGRRRDALERFLEDVVLRNFPVLPYDQAAADWHATERARQSKAGRPTPFVDGQIAAVAFVNHLVLVTDNVADFAPFQMLVVENWLSRAR